MPRIFHHTIIIIIGAGISKVLGLVRDASIAWLLGNSITADALATALRIPFLFRRLLGEGTLSMGLVRVCQYEAMRDNVGAQAAIYLTRRIAIILSVFVILLIAMPQTALMVLAPGFENKPLLSRETSTLFRICLPYAVFATLAAGSTAVLYTKKYFLPPALSPIIFNCAMLAGAFAAIGSSLKTMGIILACGALFGGLLQWIIPLPLISRLKKNEPIFSPNKKQIKKLLLHVPINILAAAAPQLAFILASTLTSFMPTGSVSALFYAERVIELPIGALSGALGVALLPKLIALRHDEKFSLISQEISQQISLCCCVCLPATAGLMSVASPLVRAIFYHGSFTPKAVQITTLALCAYAPSLFATALSRILISSAYAFDQHKKPFFSALIALIVSALSGALFIRPLGMLGPPIGVSLGLWVYCFLLWKNLSKTIKIRLPIQKITTQTIATACMFIISSALAGLLSETPLIALSVVVPISVGAYGVLLWLIDKNQVKELLGFIKQKTPNSNP